MKRLYILIALILGIFVLSACAGIRIVRGTGSMTEEVREVSDFDAVDLDGIGTIFIEQSDKESLRIEAEDNLMKFLETEVEGNTLRLTTRNGINIVPTQGIFYYLTVKNLQKIAVNGVGNVDLQDLNTPRLRLDINGGGEINAQKLEANQLDVGINGLGSLNLEGGQVVEQRIDISGGGSYEARNLPSETADITINGIGSANVWADERLDVNISGGGSVGYTGKPQLVQNINGLGTVNTLSE